MASNLLDGQVDDILHSTLAGTGGEVYVVNPRQNVVEDLVEVATEHDGEFPVVRMIADDGVLRDVMNDFLVASNAADLVDNGALEMRTADDLPTNSLVITEESVVTVVDVGSRVGGLAAKDPEFVSSVRDSYRLEWEMAEEYALRTPAISQVRDTIGEDMGPDAEEDFSSVLSSLETARGDGDGLDEVTISLLVAAKNEELFYDVSRWGEDVGVASKATFSRMKNELEDTGLITTEKVPVDVGRPRQRLTLSDDRLRNAEGDQLATVAQSLLN